MQIRFRHLAMLAALAVAFQAAQAQDAKSLVKKELPLKVEIEAAQAAIDACTAKKVSVHVFILDAEGNVRLLLIPDTAHWDTLDGARRKGYTAFKTGEPTINLMKRRGDVPSTLPKDPYMVFLGGAVPIKIGNELIGVLSAGGGAPEQDAECAQAGADKIQPYLK
jgi:uncharacterized protein GlcG (DUF336 family)